MRPEASARPERISRVSQHLPQGGGARVRSTADDLTKIRDRVWRNFVSAYKQGKICQGGDIFAGLRLRGRSISASPSAEVDQRHRDPDDEVTQKTTSSRREEKRGDIADSV